MRRYRVWPPRQHVRHMCTPDTLHTTQWHPWLELKETVLTAHPPRDLEPVSAEIIVWLDESLARGRARSSSKIQGTPRSTLLFRSRPYYLAFSPVHGFRGWFLAWSRMCRHCWPRVALLITEPHMAADAESWNETSMDSVVEIGLVHKARDDTRSQRGTSVRTFPRHQQSRCLTPLATIVVGLLAERIVGSLSPE